MKSRNLREILNNIYRSKIKSKNTMQNLEHLRKTQWLSRSEIEEYQWNKLVCLLRYAKKRVPYYKKLLEDIDFKKLDKEEFRKIPFLDKKRIKDNFDDIISEGYEESDLKYNSTSGSTGEKLNFYKDKKRIKKGDHLRPATNLRSWEWAGIDIWDRKIKLWGLHPDIPRSLDLQGKLSDWLKNRKFLSAYALKEETMEKYRKKINSYRPRLIISQPSVMYTFSNYLMNSGLEIHKPEGVTLSAETLYPYQRKAIKDVFDCEIFNRYGSREFGDIAHECEKHNGLHVYSERVFLEVIDEDGDPCEPGELGELVVTDLDNYGFPFIRYKIGDIAIRAEDECDCGRGLPLLASIEGRTFDVVVCPNGNHLTGTFWTILLRERIDGIHDFRLIQKRKDKIKIEIVKDDRFDKKEERKLLKIISQKCGESMDMDLIEVDRIENERSGKKRFVVSDVDIY